MERASQGEEIVITVHGKPKARLLKCRAVATADLRLAEAARAVGMTVLNIREVRPGYYMVDHQRAGKRERVCFDDVDKAKSYCAVLSTKITNEGTAALSLTPAQRDDAAKALAILEGHATLEKAAAFWALHNRDQGATVAEVGTTCGTYEPSTPVLAPFWTVSTNSGG